MMKRWSVVLTLSTALLGHGCSLLTLGRKIREPVRADYSVHDPAFRHSMGNLLGAPMVEGNTVTELLNGDRIFSAMLEDIRKAERTITLEMFIWSSGKVSDKFIEALTERARAGVKVLVIIDAVGSNKLKRKDIRALEKAGVDVVKYNRPASFKFYNANHRTHRKLMVVDGRIGFIGGVCINDDWAGNAEPPKWRDTHFRVTGPVVGQLQAAFADNWLQMRSEVLHGDRIFPAIEPSGEMIAQGFKSGPREGAESARLTYLLSIAAAKKSIRISHAYFVPDDLVIKGLVEARKRGVRVEVIVPMKIDNLAVRKAGWSRWRELLKAGVEFYEYTPTLYHCKVMIVDDIWCIVGSVNFDDRSLRINDEANLNVLNRAFAARLIETFEDDKRLSNPLKYEEFKRRNFITRLFDHLAGLFRSQL